MQAMLQATLNPQALRMQVMQQLAGHMAAGQVPVAQQPDATPVVEAQVVEPAAQAANAA